VCEVQPVEYPPPQVRVIDPHAFQRGMQLMVALGLREPSQRLRLRQVVSFAYVLLRSPFYDTERKCLRPRLLLACRTGPMRLFTRVRETGILRTSALGRSRNFMRVREICCYPNGLMTKARVYQVPAANAVKAPAIKR
jgi:hypothetical protein